MEQGWGALVVWAWRRRARLLWTPPSPMDLGGDAVGEVGGGGDVGEDGGGVGGDDVEDGGGGLEGGEVVVEVGAAGEEGVEVEI